jgi:pimeloyl-ACP methyl ester carboxylesterase
VPAPEGLGDGVGVVAAGADDDGRVLRVHPVRREGVVTEPGRLTPRRRPGHEVHLWHGERDRYVPVEHARALAAALPRCRARFDAQDGHFFFRRRVAEVLGALVAAAQPPNARAAAATISP